MLLEYIIIFIVFSVFGWLYEYILFDRRGPDRVIKKIFGIDMPTLMIYGLGGMILYFIYTQFETYNVLSKSLIAAITIVPLECIFGLLSYKFNGYQTWNYKSNLCCGYISIKVALWWFILSLIAFTAFNRYENKN